MLGRKAEYIEAVEVGENVGWDNFPDEHSRKGGPEEFYSFSVPS